LRLELLLLNRIPQGSSPAGLVFLISVVEGSDGRLAPDVFVLVDASRAVPQPRLKKVEEDRRWCFYSARLLCTLPFYFLVIADTPDLHFYVSDEDLVDMIESM
jgi:hypothetical protein